MCVCVFVSCGCFACIHGFSFGVPSSFTHAESGCGVSGIRFKFASVDGSLQDLNIRNIIPDSISFSIFFSI